MRFISICSGIEAASVAAKPLNWQCAAVSEIDPFCKRLLRHHYPEVPNLGDFTRIRQRSPLSRFVSSCDADLLCAGTPCQDFSVAGRRGGILDTRGNLTLELVALLYELQRKRPRWFVWENVPGVLSSWSDVSQETAGPSDGWEQSDFDLFLSLLEECGYGIAYRVLDAQFFGVPQRRRRVFVVGYLGDWRRAAAVLFDRDCLSWDFTAGGKEGEDVAPTISARTKGGGGLGTDFDCDGGLIMPPLLAQGNETGGHRPPGSTVDSIGHLIPILEAGARTGKSTSDLRAGIGIGEPGDPMFTLQSGKQHAVAFHARQDPIFANVSLPLEAKGGQAVAFNLRGRDGGSQPELSHLASVRSSSGGSSRSYVQTSGVRRLTPRECERLMGFPDDYTLIPTYLKRQKETGADALALYAYYCRTSRGQAFTQFRNGRVYVTPDGPRYKALGNSWAIPCVRWIFSRIDEVDKL